MAIQDRSYHSSTQFGCLCRMAPDEPDDPEQLWLRQLPPGRCSSIPSSVMTPPSSGEAGLRHFDTPGHGCGMPRRLGATDRLAERPARSPVRRVSESSGLLQPESSDEPERLLDTDGTSKADGIGRGLVVPMKLICPSAPAGAVTARRGAAGRSKGVGEPLSSSSSSAPVSV